MYFSDSYTERECNVYHFLLHVYSVSHERIA